MDASDISSQSQAVDLSKYAEDILTGEDRPLFDEAVRVARAGALRSAYLMVWLACAESLKRRFNEAKTRDDVAGRIAGEIEKREVDRRSVDKYLLDEAQSYGFISDSGKTVLTHIYEKRCIFAHPYEEGPSEEQLMEAASAIVELLLSKPIKLRYGYGKQLLGSLLGDQSFLDDQEAAVVKFAKSIPSRLDERVHTWLLDQYWAELERLSSDPSMAIFFRRGIWFCRTMLDEIGVETLDHEEWHGKVSSFPRTMIDLCCHPLLFGKIGELAQNSVIGAILQESETSAGVLAGLEGLGDAGSLSERQRERLDEHVSGLSWSVILASGLSTKTCYPRLIKALKSSNWYTQNPAINMIVSNGPEQAAELSEDKQENLGRNLLQAGEGTSASAIRFLEQLSRDMTGWPVGILRGITLESFTNEDDEIRFKDFNLKLVLSALELLNDKERGEIIAEITASVGRGTPKIWINQRKLDPVIAELSKYSWTEPLMAVLKSRFPEE